MQRDFSPYRLPLTTAIHRETIETRTHTLTQASSNLILKHTPTYTLWTEFQLTYTYSNNSATLSLLSVTRHPHSQHTHIHLTPTLTFPFTQIVAFVTPSSRMPNSCSALYDQNCRFLYDFILTYNDCDIS